MFRRKSLVSKNVEDIQALRKPQDVKRTGLEYSAEDPQQGRRNSEYNFAEIEELQVIYDEKASGYAIAIGEVYGRPVCLIRWNGQSYENEDSNKMRDAGSPWAGEGENGKGGASRWFVLPSFLNTPVLEAVAKQHQKWLNGQQSE